MALIIPEAQTPFNPAGQPRLNPNAASGAEGIGAVTDTFIAIKAQKVKVEQDRAVRSARLTAMEELDKVRFKYETDTNLDGLTDRWEAEAGKSTAAIAATLPAHLRGDFEVAMREMAAPQTSAIRRREYALFQDQERAYLNADLRSYEARAAAAPTEEARDAVYLEAASAIGAAQDGGLVSAEEADAVMAGIPAGAEAIVASRLINEDPQGYLDIVAAGGFGNLPPKTRSDYELAAKANVSTEAARKASEDDALDAVAAKQRASRTGEAISIMDAGLAYGALPELLAEAAGTPDEARLRGAAERSALMAKMARMSPADQKTEIENLANSATTNPSTVETLAAAKALNVRTEAALQADPLSHVRDLGIMALGPMNIADPAGVKDRIAAAETLFTKYTPEATSIKYFDKAEADRLAAIVAAPDTDAALGVFTAIAANFGDRAPAALAQIGANDPVAYLAGTLVAGTGDTAAARSMLRGRQLLKDGKGATLSAVNRRAVRADLSSTIRGAQLVTLEAAADAHYAAEGYAVLDPASEEAKDAYLASVNAVTGQRKVGDVTYGGIQLVHDTKTLLPLDLTAPRVERALVYFDDKQWQLASVSGQLPVGLANYSAADREQFSVLSLPDGSYALGYRQQSGAVAYLQDAANRDGIFRFDLHTFVTGVPAP